MRLHSYELHLKWKQPSSTEIITFTFTQQDHRNLQLRFIFMVKTNLYNSECLQRAQRKVATDGSFLETFLCKLNNCWRATSLETQLLRGALRVVEIKGSNGKLGDCEESAVAVTFFLSVIDLRSVQFEIVYLQPPHLLYLMFPLHTVIENLKSEAGETINQSFFFPKCRFKVSSGHWGKIYNVYNLFLNSKVFFKKTNLK